MSDTTALPPPVTSTASLPPLLPKAVVIASIVALLGFCGVQGYVLFQEWASLRRELDRGARTAFIGYVNINPKINNARHPANFIHDEGDQTLVWAEWADGAHRWFRLPKGQIQAAQFSTPLGKDRARAIDNPVIETSGGPRWERIHDESHVVSHKIAGVTSAYPLKVIEKVLVVNDLVEGVPYIVAYSPFERGDDAVCVYDAAIDGKRINLGHSGYFIGPKSVYYDRETESFWVPGDEGLEAIAGARKGTILKRISRPERISWASWRSDHPDGRLLVGANRP